MTAWTADELARIDRADELQIASTRADGTLRPYVIIWAVRVGDDLFVRSAGGPTNPWFVRAVASGTGRVRAGGVERDVTFVDAPAQAHAAIDAAYLAKYDRYGPAVVGSVVGPGVRDVTLRLEPRDVRAPATPEPPLNPRDVSRNLTQPGVEPPPRRAPPA